MKVKRGSVTVRARRQFTAGAAVVRTAESEILRTLRDPLPATDIPIKLTTYALRDRQQDKMRLLIAAEVDRAVNPSGEMSLGTSLSISMASSWRARQPPRCHAVDATANQLDGI